MGYWIGIIGCWLLSDGIISWNLYVNSATYNSDAKQTFRKDHWVRLVRIICAVILIAIGWSIV